MSEQEALVADEQEIEMPSNQQGILDFLKHIEDGDFTNAERGFNSLVNDKITDVLDQTKMKLADEIFNDYEENSEEEVEYEEDFDEDDEEIEDDEEEDEDDDDEEWEDDDESEEDEEESSEN